MSSKSDMRFDIQLDEIYSPAQAAEFIRLSPKQIARLIDSGYLDGGRRSPMPGSHRFTTGRAILNYLEMRNETAVPIN